MKIDSPLFDSIRVKPNQDRRRQTGGPACEWPKCKSVATHKAPKGRGQGETYWHFCLGHVREYNHSYNFFAGMSTDDIAKYQKDAVTGHRPTWKMGFNGGVDGLRAAQGATDPFDVLREFGPGGRPRVERPAPEARTVRNAERKAFDTLGLDIDAAAVEIKARFKALVKRHHPDANGGDRSSEDKLREIIQAYNYLKSVGFR